MNQNLDLKSFRGNIFLNHHNLIKTKFSLLSNESITPDASIQKVKSPLFITNFNFQPYRPTYKNKSFSSLSSTQNENQKKFSNTLSSFHHQINFQNYKNRKKNDFFSQIITENKIISKPLSESKSLKSPKNQKAKEIFSKIDTKIKKRASLDDVMDILKTRELNKKNILKEFLDPKVDLSKFYIQKADQKSIELSKGGKKRTKISIIPINKLEKIAAPPQVSTERNALQNFFQKSLKGNYHAMEKENLNNIHEEIWGDVEEIKQKLYDKLAEKPKQEEEECAYFRFSEKTIAGIGKEKFEKMKINFNRRKNPIDLDNYQCIGDPKLTYEDLNFVKEQYLSSSQWKDYKLLEMLTRNLKFFHTISKDSRMIILKNAEFLEIPSNEIIPAPEECQSVFIILKGGVNLKGTFQKNQVDNTLILSSYFDGDYFGDYSKETSWNFSNQPKKGLLTIKNPFFQTFEQTFALRILFKIWDGLINKLIKRDLDEKLKILKNIGLFQEEQQRTLFPLASQMQMRFYKLGEVVINEGDFIDCFYIIANGRCALLFKQSDEEQKKRVFPSECQNDCIRVLHENDYFGTRAIFSDEELLKKSRKFGETINKYSNFTVVADRDATLLLRLEQKSFFMLPLELQNKLRAIFFEVMEFDTIDVEKLQKEMDNWTNTKKNIKRFIMGKKK